MHLLSDLLPTFFPGYDHSLWNYSKALADREIHPLCSVVALIDERSAKTPVSRPVRDG